MDFAKKAPNYVVFNKYLSFNQVQVWNFVFSSCRGTFRIAPVFLDPLIPWVAVLGSHFVCSCS